MTPHDFRDYTDLPAIMTDLLLEHPQMAALFQQAMQGTAILLAIRWWATGWRSCSTRACEPGRSGAPWGLHAPANEQDRATLAINLIAMFNLTTGYFLSQRAFDSLGGGQLQDPENIARQKRLLHKVVRAMLIS